MYMLFHDPHLNREITKDDQEDPIKLKRGTDLNFYMTVDCRIKIN